MVLPETETWNTASLICSEMSWLKVQSRQEWVSGRLTSQGWCHLCSWAFCLPRPVFPFASQHTLELTVSFAAAIGPCKRNDPGDPIPFTTCWDTSTPPQGILPGSQGPRQGRLCLLTIICLVKERGESGKQQPLAGSFQNDHSLTCASWQFVGFFFHGCQGIWASPSFFDLVLEQKESCTWSL